MFFHVRALGWWVSLFLPLPLLAATWRVNNTPGSLADHASIQAAIDAAASGDTVLVEGSVTTYAGFTLRDKRLTIIGPGYRLGANLGTPVGKLGAVIAGSDVMIHNTSSTPAPAGDSVQGSLILGLELRSRLSVMESAQGITISRCYFEGNLSVFGPMATVSQCYFAPMASPEFGASGLRMENCLLLGSVRLQSPAPSPTDFYFGHNLLPSLPSLPTGAVMTLDNNLFRSAMTTMPAGVVARNNLFYGPLPANLVGTGNLAYTSHLVVMPHYDSTVASFDSRYELAPSVATGPVNPALHGGVDGTHIGPFGGANPYILSGVPPLPTIDELSVPQFAAPGGELVIRVKVSERP